VLQLQLREALLICSWPGGGPCTAQQQ
jgi:hypothetical protein